MTYRRLTDVLADFWEKSWSKLPKKQRQAWHDALGALGGDTGMDGNLWDGQDAKGRKYVAENHDAQHDPITRDSEEGHAHFALGFWAAAARDFGAVDWDYWISLQSWTSREAACLLTELDPNEYDKAARNNNPQPIALVRRIADIERRAIRDNEVGLLQTNASPLVWAVWADANGYALPKRINECDAQEVGAGETAEITPAQRRANTDMTTRRGVPRYILENWNEIERLHPTGADGRQVLRVLVRRQDAGASTPKLHNVQNALINLRREKLIP